MTEINFCPECNNILYAKADTRKQQLRYFCRQCDFSRVSDSNSSSDNCIYRTSYHFSGKEDIFVSPQVVKDPTLGRTTRWKCLKCGHQKAVFFQLPERVTDDAMMLVFVCTNPGCGYYSKQLHDDGKVELTNEFGNFDKSKFQQIDRKRERPLDLEDVQENEMESFF
ncbi:DNA-directed RNA polymerase 2 subunit [Theileria orientalis strain Shintoku]|uniref:DNA-directed RNA polymerase 2 subunit n=1 Tax=Theileria orientalis strain Shintoku TaxID=869250 RepID=J4D726_THEOR|nr:DNA-directed RNA polymerase 2 subunit [Theileria orientalis strain Shintoku]BAM39920.1 DNA-directed RNA polymerase 2 subunit [Theileria orientalis strain Shintoku]|eukprot:XP_009690221.1 DNA-directed RNA polymerase 2 subunit [Theileria orientalis strain Shintoku]